MQTRPASPEQFSPTTPERRFNYKQIYEASNVLVNQPHEAGITNGDVVMIFAYRSVELVIAWTTTAISRRASRIMDEELALKIRVPELRMSDDGRLTGGEVNGKEFFTNNESKASAPSDDLVGPDSTSIPSFTSGTTSTPKYRIQRVFKFSYLDDSGNCAIRGRADDQVNVRGFRIELNEIDNNWRGHHVVRECKTLPRTDRDEESTLVSYIVPDHQEWLSG
ncbi:hypothetical protein G7046_g6898 [Stylonectria norvegica]|nr:hypothetical protein G7046_g6898 [Stylonectria norvegica]